MILNTLFSIVSSFNIIPCILLNLLVIYLVRKFSPKALGTYKYLLISFASCDIFLVVLHAIINPKVIARHGAFGVISLNFLSNKYITIMYGACFTLPFLLLDIHFLYRYWAVSPDSLIYLFDKKWFIVGLIIIVFAVGSFWYSLLLFATVTNVAGVSESLVLIAQEFNTTSIDGWLIFRLNDKLTLNSEISLILLDIAMIICLGFSITLASLTYFEIKRTNELSSSDKSMQITLLVVASVQTFVPFVCVYIPYLYVLSLPFLNTSSALITNISTVLHAIFPTLDAIVIIALMKPYRRGLMGMLRRRKAPVIPHLYAFTADITSVVTARTVVPCILLNLLVIYLVRRFSPKSLGTYKYLLISFASCDIFLVILHAIIKPKVIARHGGFGVISLNFLSNKYVMIMYGACFTLPFLLLDIHFLYRYWAVTPDSLIYLFEKKWFILCLLILVLAVGSFWYTWLFLATLTDVAGVNEALAIIAKEFNTTSIDGWLIFRLNDELTFNSKISLIFLDIAMALCLALSITLASLTYFQIERTKTLSLSDRSMQITLLVVASVQTFVPFVCVYIPYLYVLALPFLNSSSSFITDISTVLHAIFPSLDALVIIAMMKPYRMGLIRMMRKTAPVKRLQTFTATSVGVQ